MSQSGELEEFLARLVEELDRLRAEFATGRKTSGAAMGRLEEVRVEVGERARRWGREEPTYRFLDPTVDLRPAVADMMLLYLQDVCRCFPEVRSSDYRGWKVELEPADDGQWSAVVVGPSGESTRSRIERRYLKRSEALSKARSLIDSLTKKGT